MRRDKVGGAEIRALAGSGPRACGESCSPTSAQPIWSRVTSRPYPPTNSRRCSTTRKKGNQPPALSTAKSLSA